MEWIGVGVGVGIRFNSLLLHFYFFIFFPFAARTGPYITLCMYVCDVKRFTVHFANTIRIEIATWNRFFFANFGYLNGFNILLHSTVFKYPYFWPKNKQTDNPKTIEIENWFKWFDFDGFSFYLFTASHIHQLTKVFNKLWLSDWCCFLIWLLSEMNSFLFI